METSRLGRYEADAAEDATDDSERGMDMSSSNNGMHMSSTSRRRPAIVGASTVGSSQRGRQNGTVAEALRNSSNLNNIAQEEADDETQQKITANMTNTTHNKDGLTDEDYLAKMLAKRSLGSAHLQDQLYTTAPLPKEDTSTKKQDRDTRYRNSRNNPRSKGHGSETSTTTETQLDMSFSESEGNPDMNGSSLELAKMIAKQSQNGVGIGVPEDAVTGEAGEEDSSMELAKIIAKRSHGVGMGVPEGAVTGEAGEEDSSMELAKIIAKRSRCGNGKDESETGVTTTEADSSEPTGSSGRAVLQHGQRPGAYAAAPGERQVRLPPLAFELLSEQQQQQPPLLQTATTLDQQQLSLQTTDPPLVEDSPEEMENGVASGVAVRHSNRKRSILAEARPVFDPSSFFFPQTHAEEYDEDMDDSRRQRKEKTRKTILGCSLAAGCVVVVGIVVLVVFLTGGDEDQPQQLRNVTNSSNNSTSSTPAPSTLTYEDYILSLLPEHSQREIAENMSLPQERAFQWLLEDLNGNGSVVAAAAAADETTQIRQRFSLATLYYATNGDEDWFKNDHWLSHEHHECEWYWSNTTEALVTDNINLPEEYFTPKSNCDENGKMIHLWLANNGLESRLPEELYLLTNLISINFAENKLQGTISERIGALTDLEALGMKKNELTGPIPSSLPKEKLLHIVLGFNSLSAQLPHTIGYLQNLTLLEIETNLFTGSLPSELGLLGELTHLNARHPAAFLPSLDNLANWRNGWLWTSTLLAPCPASWAGLRL